jgi:large subunit ribosomal protein L13
MTNSNKTHSFNEAEIDRKWYVVDASKHILGRMSADIARILQGKHKPQYTPHVDTGDYVVVLNARDVKLSGKKKEMKLYRHHSGYIGGLKEVPISRMMEKKPGDVIRLAVQGMMPKTKLGRKMLRKLRVYPGPEHDHAAQKPEKLELCKE